MSTPINSLSAVKPELSDLLAIWDVNNTSTRRTSVNYLLELFQDNYAVNKPTTQYSAPSATGFSVDMLDTGVDVHLILTPNAGYAAGTLVLPSSVIDKQTVLVNCTQIVTALTITSNKTVTGAPTTLAANDYFTLKYDASLEVWYRVG